MHGLHLLFASARKGSRAYGGYTNSFKITQGSAVGLEPMFSTNTLNDFLIKI